MKSILICSRFLLFIFLIVYCQTATSESVNNKSKIFGNKINPEMDRSNKDRSLSNSNQFFEQLRDTFPEFNISTYTIKVPLFKKTGYAKDSVHLFCDSVFVYSIDALIPDSLSPWPINDQIGNQNCISQDSPYETLCLLLKAYRSKNIDSILRFYRPADSLLVINRLSDSVRNASFFHFLDSLDYMNIFMGYQINSTFIALVGVNLFNDRSFVTPYFFEEVNNQWFVSVVDDSSSLLQNTWIYLNNPSFDYSDLTTTNDLDNDGIINEIDNCPCIPNPDQLDSDNDNIGNVCDNCVNNHNTDQKDADYDGIGNPCDNCFGLPNPSQRDQDLDSYGDPCDNCPKTQNTSQLDSDDDYWGDACDNCPEIYNPHQEDGDNDYIGDICDNCPGSPNIDQADMDDDGIGDVCDWDSDGDGIDNNYDTDLDDDTISNENDNCVMVKNPGQSDMDSDGRGDACDNCPQVANFNQKDTDFDGIGDDCDPDIDGDFVLNENDNCPYVFNPDQVDENCNGIGDACEEE
jgi:hypothetical protein